LWVNHKHHFDCFPEEEEKMNVVDRVKNILLNPKSEWAVVRAESAGIQQIYMQYLVIVAALPALGGLLSMAYLGLGYGLRLAVTNYLVSLVAAYINALIIDNLATSFGSTKSLLNAFKLVAYAWTPILVAGFLAFVPGMGGIIRLVGALYSIYLFYLGLPMLMQTPQNKVVPYMIAAFVAGIVVYFVLAWVLGLVLGVSLVGY
jgi:hypothetical protein